MTFRNDAAWDLRLREGQLAERALGRVLLVEGEVVVEVKTEPESRTHLYVETESFGRPSGILTTEADWYAFETGPVRWALIRTQELARLAYRAQAEGRVRKGGDRLASGGVVIPKVWLVGVGL